MVLIWESWGLQAQDVPIWTIQTLKLLRRHLACSIQGISFGSMSFKQAYYVKDQMDHEIEAMYHIPV